jgi:hypothetical protein
VRSPLATGPCTALRFGSHRRSRFLWPRRPSPQPASSGRRRTSCRKYTSSSGHSGFGHVHPLEEAILTLRDPVARGWHLYSSRLRADAISRDTSSPFRTLRTCKASATAVISGHTRRTSATALTWRYSFHCRKMPKAEPVRSLGSCRNQPGTGPQAPDGN